MKRLIILALILLTACATARLERRLSPDVRGWYDEHKIIMDGTMPPELWPEGKPITEKKFFLALPVEAQRKYMGAFWKLRWSECETQWKARREYARLFYSAGGRKGKDTDRGYVLLICGPPIDEQRYPDQKQSSGMVKNEEDIEGNSFMAWSYPNRGQVVHVWFRYRADDWRLEPISAANGNETFNLIADCLRWWYPWDWVPWEEARG